MITDIFARRYADVLDLDIDWADRIIGPTLVQARYIFDDIHRMFRFPDTFYRDINQKLAREFSLESLKEYPYSQMSEMESSVAFLSTPFRIGNQWFGVPDYYCKTRLSMLELLFREAEDRGRGPFDDDISRRLAQTTISNAIQELNARLRMNGTGLTYNNGFLHLADDQLTAERIAKPLWEIVADSKWVVVDREMKEAIDGLDRRQHDAFAHATDALESTIKIISNDKGWTRGNEKGAANYIDNLVSAKNGRFIEVWEADALKAIFSNLRNPHRHGGGNTPPTPLSDAQQTWAIESCMSWIKSLVRRM